MSATRLESALILENDLLKLHLSSIKSDKDPFVKPRSHFLEKERDFIPIPDQSKAHTFMLFNKQPKAGGSEQRSKNEWIEITSPYVDEKSKEAFCRFNVLMGDIFRFELGNTLPKYRLEQCADGTYKLLSKKLHNCIGSDFYNYFDEKIYSNVIYKLKDIDGKVVREFTYEGAQALEGMGGAFAMKYLYADNDFHFSNALAVEIDGHIIFVPIDNDKALWPFTHPFLTSEIQQSESLDKEKKMSYVSEYKNSIAHFDPIRRVYDYSKIAGVTHGNMGHQNEEDYRTLPCQKYRTPKNWEWMDHTSKYYSKSISRNPMVENEISFFQLKATLTPYLKKLVGEYQYRKPEFSELKAKFHINIQKELSDSKEICEQSPVIHAFMQTHRIALLQTIIYEVNLAFHDNKHYIPENKQTWELIWSSLSNLITQNFNNMLTVQKLPPLNETEIENLKLFSKQCETNPPAVIPNVIKFYETMDRKYAAYAANKRLLALNAKTSSEAKLESCSMRI